MPLSWGNAPIAPLPWHPSRLSRLKAVPAVVQSHPRVVVGEPVLLTWPHGTTKPCSRTSCVWYVGVLGAPSFAACMLTV